MRKLRSLIDLLQHRFTGFRVFGILLLAICCAPTDSQPDQEVVAMIGDAPIGAVIRSVEFSVREVREGMRLVHVTAELQGDSPREITVTEWVPVVLLRQLAVGASVHLIRDPARNRLTIGF